MKELLKSHVGETVGVNLIHPTHIDETTLVSVGDEYFTVSSSDDENTYHIPFFNIVKVLSNTKGVTIPGFFTQHRTFPLIIKIGHVVAYVPT